MKTYRTRYASPYGMLQVRVDDDGVLVELLLPNRGPFGVFEEPPAHVVPAIDRVRKQLDEYFAGSRTHFDLPLRPHGTEFERRVWERLLQIPYGTTITYGDIALEFGMLNAARAVGRANGANPIPIVIPCHRVIGSNGKLTGFGGGLPLKEALLRLEGAILV